LVPIAPTTAYFHTKTIPNIEYSVIYLHWTRLVL